MRTVDTIRIVTATITILVLICLLSYRRQLVPFPQSSDHVMQATSMMTPITTGPGILPENFTKSILLELKTLQHLY